MKKSLVLKTFEDNKEDILRELKEAERDSFFNPSFSGFYFKLFIGESGYTLLNPTSSGITMDCHEGKELLCCSVDACKSLSDLWEDSLENIITFLEYSEQDFDIYIHAREQVESMEVLSDDGLKDNYDRDYVLSYHYDNYSNFEYVEGVIEAILKAYPNCVLDAQGEAFEQYWDDYAEERCEDTILQSIEEYFMAN